MVVVALLLLEIAGPMLPSAAASVECPEAIAGEIVVCSRPVDPGRYRLPKGLPPETAGPPKAEWRIGSGGTTLGVAAVAKAMPQGVTSNRVMATVKIPF